MRLMVLFHRNINGLPEVVQKDRLTTFSDRYILVFVNDVG